jgi:glyceraldehyde 3-phosphate dehydrogenase
MPIPFAINGLGRIGRALVRIARQRPDVELVAVNDLGSAGQLARLLAHDSLHGAFAGTVSATADRLRIDGRDVASFQESEAERIPWGETGARVVVDATGLCKTRSAAERHLRQGVERVVVSANAEVDLTLCIGVNDAAYDPANHTLLSAASCTTNCLTPLAYLLEGEFGIERALVNTVHSYNNDQRLLGAPHRDPRRARAAALNMIPTTTSAIEAMERVLPALAGRFQGFAIRVPTPNVSLVDLAADLVRPTTVDQVHALLREAAADRLAGVLAVTDEELVSSDYMSRTESAIVDLPLTQLIDGKLLRLVAWYDNEWGHASRLADVLELIAGRK